MDLRSVEGGVVVTVIRLARRAVRGTAVAVVMAVAMVWAVVVVA